MQNLSTDIARRYLFGKKSTNSINVITGISVFGISVGTAALVLILSVFNGFESLLSGLFNSFNPDLKIVPKEGKFFVPDSSMLSDIYQIEGIYSLSQSVEEVALFEYKGTQEIGIIKGVDLNFQKTTGLDSLIVDGKFKLIENRVSFGVLGSGMRNKLSLNIRDQLNPVSIYMPLKKKKMFGAKEYKVQELYPAGVFSVKSDNDYQYILTNINFVQRLLGEPHIVSALEIQIDASASQENIIVQLEKVFGDQFLIKNRYQQDEAFLKVMEIEKWISFLITSFTMILIAFNLLGALWMIALDKKKDITVLKAMGFTDTQVRNTFLRLGGFISVIGLFIGFIIAVTFFYIQKQFGIISVPAGFLIDSYPIKLKVTDFLIVSATVLTISMLAAILPAQKASRSKIALRAH